MMLPSTLYHGLGLFCWFLISSTVSAAEDIPPSSPTLPSTSRLVRISNNSPLTLAVHWQNGRGRFGQRVTGKDGIIPGKAQPLHAEVGHTFQIYEVPNAETGLCQKSLTGHDLIETCWTFPFTVGDGEEQEVTVDRDLQASHTSTVVYAKQAAEAALSHCKELEDETHRRDCVLKATSDSLQEWNQEWSVRHQGLKRLGGLLEEYACNTPDNNPPTSPSIREETWQDATVQILHDRPSSQIHLLEDFVTEEECEAVQEIAQKRGLQQAHVQSGEEGQPPIRNERRQAGVPIPWHLPNHPLAQLGHRILDYTRHVLPTLNITHQGQEDLMSSVHHGQFESRCNGICGGSPVERMATMILHCQVAEVGGHTHFGNTGVHVRPQPGQALFISFIDPETFQKDNGLTQHTKCPIWHGSQHIVTQRIQRSVDEESE